MHLLRFDGSAKSKGSTVLTKFLCENIREKVKWKGLSFCSKIEKMCIVAILSPNDYQLAMRREREKVHKRTEDQPPPATLVYQMNMMLLSLGCIHLEQTSFWPAFQFSFP